jgi:aminocarboxymuconate-semialdehyde decarboxylase
MAQTIGGWDVHTISCRRRRRGGRARRFGMRASSDTLTICAHGVPLHPLTEVNKLADRVKSDHLDGAIVSVPPPLFRPDLSEADCRDYAKACE